MGYKQDADDVYDVEFGDNGGYLCALCGTPTDRIPCAEHQPNTFASIVAFDASDPIITALDDRGVVG